MKPYRLQPSRALQDIRIKIPVGKYHKGFAERIQNGSDLLHDVPVTRVEPHSVDEVGHNDNEAPVEHTFRKPESKVRRSGDVKASHVVGESLD